VTTPHAWGPLCLRVGDILNVCAILDMLLVLNVLLDHGPRRTSDSRNEVGMRPEHTAKSNLMSRYPLGTNTVYFSKKTCYACLAFIVHQGMDILL
jgi:hypothetical protein